MPTWADGAIRSMRHGGIRFAVAGGLAANNYMPPRNTDDFDIAVRLADLPAAEAAVAAAGWDRLGPLALYGGLEGSAWRDDEGDELDLIGVPGELGERAIHEAQGNLITAGLPTITLPFMVVLKLIAARPEDTADLARMLGRADEASLAATRAAVGRYLAAELPELEQFIALGRLEYASTSGPVPGLRTATPQVIAGEVRCRVCRRILTGDAARRAGIGPDCAEKERRGLTRPMRASAPRTPPRGGPGTRSGR